MSARRPAPALRPVPAGRLQWARPAVPTSSRCTPVDVAAFRLGRTPVTRAQYAPFLRRRGRAPPWWHDPAFAGRISRSWASPGSSAWRSRNGWREAAGAGACPPKPSGSGRRAAASCRRRPRGATRCPRARCPRVRSRALAGRPRHAERLRPARHGHDRPRVVRRLVRAPYYAVAASGAGPRSARRASRGGSWRHRVRWSPPSARSSLPPAFRYADYGFRVVCAPG